VKFHCSTREKCLSIRFQNLQQFQGNFELEKRNNTMKQKQPRWRAMKLETQGIKKVMGLGANRKTRI
jgi:hypothetical protein